MSGARPGTLEIVTDVVKIKAPFDEIISSHVRVINLEEVQGCAVEVVRTQVETTTDAWIIRLTFRIVVSYLDIRGKTRTATRLLFFTKKVPFPPGCRECGRLTPRIEVSDMDCEATADVTGPCIAKAEVTLEFTLTFKALQREEITVLVPPTA
ncbi:MAG TPA: hypothetical protein VGK74_09400 [Symbiobacteriaceae bacterium]|jgi:hypothetical protein